MIDGYIFPLPINSIHVQECVLILFFRQHSTHDCPVTGHKSISFRASEGPLQGICISDIFVSVFDYDRELALIPAGKVYFCLPVMNRNFCH